MAKTSKPDAMPGHVSNAHTDAFANIAFGKKQQWAITNYVALIYAAIVAVNGKLDQVRSEVFPVLIVVVAGYAIFLIYRVQCSVHKSRKRLAAINARWFSEEERALLDLSSSAKGFFHDWPFMTGLWSAIVIGGLLAIGVVTF